MESLEILIVSDATGSTAEAVVTSILVQFGRANIKVRRKPFTRTVDQVRKVVENVTPPGVVVFTFVSSELSEAMLELGAARGLTVVDLLGPLMGIFAEALQSLPSRTPGVFRGQSEEMFKIIEAIHFTRRHDDGQGLESIDEADLIILGVSRTGKTPTSIFLSCRKLKVANVPIIRGIELAEEVRRASVPKVGFRMGDRSSGPGPVGAGRSNGHSDSGIFRARPRHGGDRLLRSGLSVHRRDQDGGCHLSIHRGDLGLDHALRPLILNLELQQPLITIVSLCDVIRD